MSDHQEMAGGTLYHRIAETLRLEIGKGVYEVGDRLPSLRGLCRRFQVSLGTAVEAYGQLQDEGWVSSRDRSGFFVARNRADLLDRPRTLSPRLAARPVTVGSLAIAVMEDARRAGLVRLGAGIPGDDLLPTGVLSRALSAAARGSAGQGHGYEELAGSLPLRRQITRLMAEAGIVCDPDEVVVTNGCQEALTVSLLALTRPGDTILVESPAFFGLLQVAEALNLKVVELPIRYGEGIDPQEFRKTLRDHPIAACLITPNISNPLGAITSDATKQKLVEIASEAGVPLIEDDIFGFMPFSASRPLAASAFDRSGNTVLCSSFSKTIAPGLRIGWVLPGKYRERIRHRKFLLNISTSGPPQMALAGALARGVFGRSVRGMMGTLQKRMERMRQDLADFFPAETRVTHPEGGLFLWVELPEGTDSERLYQRALEAGIGIIPGSLFSVGGDYRNHIRLTYAAVDETISRRAIQTLAGLI